jgi:hypothetical protein
MSSFKAGLHKKISSIFDGVPINKQNGGLAGAESASEGLAVQQTQLDSHQPAEHSQQQTSQDLYKETAEKGSKVNVKVEGKTKKFVMGYLDKLKNKLMPAKSGVSRTKQVATVVLIPVLCIVLVVVAVKVFGSGSHKKKIASKTSESSKVVENSRQIAWQTPKPLSSGLRDPMKTGSSAIRTVKGSSASGTVLGLFATDGEIILMGIVHSPEKPMAIIGQQIVTEGEKVGDFSIVKINEHSVDIEKDGQRKTLRVGQRWLTSE